jgi:hypothetical protein
VAVTVCVGVGDAEGASLVGVGVDVGASVDCDGAGVFSAVSDGVGSAVRVGRLGVAVGLGVGSAVGTVTDPDGRLTPSPSPQPVSRPPTTSRAPASAAVLELRTGVSSERPSSSRRSCLAHPRGRVVRSG